MRFIYTIHHNGRAVYHGVNAADAMEAVITCQEQGGKVDVQRVHWPVVAYGDVTAHLAA